jgi:hypothetical protein
MALNPTYIVHVERPETILPDAMNEMRIWLDHNQVELVDFKIAMTDVPGTAFDIRFRREEEAALFERGVCLAHQAGSRR